MDRVTGIAAGCVVVALWSLAGCATTRAEQTPVGRVQPGDSSTGPRVLVHYDRKGYL
jgi:hypothetical protein